VFEELWKVEIEKVTFAWKKVVNEINAFEKKIF
jgi:hypothetical protein